MDTIDNFPVAQTFNTRNYLNTSCSVRDWKYKYPVMQMFSF